MFKIARLALLIIATCFVASLCAGESAAQTINQTQINQDGAEVASFRDRLVLGLRARHPNEIRFVEDVVTLVDNRQVPQKFVDEIYFWIYKNKADQRFKFVYFERIYRLRATAAGFPVPVFVSPYPNF